MEDNKGYNYGFLFKKSNLPKYCLNDLLQLDDFIKEADKIMKNSEAFDDIAIYNIVKKIYFPMLKDCQTDGFKESYKAKYGGKEYRVWLHKFRKFREAARQFSEVLFGNTEQLESDYLAYCNQ